MHSHGRAYYSISEHRALLTPGKQGRRNTARTSNESGERILAERRATMTWAQRLTHAFNIDIETCNHPGGQVKVITGIEARSVIKKILIHLEKNHTLQKAGLFPEKRAPSASLFGCCSLRSTHVTDTCRARRYGRRESGCPDGQDGSESDAGEGGFFGDEDWIRQGFVVLAVRMTLRHPCSESQTRLQSVCGEASKIRRRLAMM